MLSELEASLLTPVYIHSKLHYIFARTTFTKEECDKLDKIFRPTLLSKTGISSKNNLNIVHANHRFGGLLLPTYWDLQGSLHLNLLLGHVQINHLPGQHLLFTMEYTYIYLGLTNPVFK